SWFLGKKLQMKYAHYGAQMGTGTFGVNLLSRYPLEETTVHFLWSTAITGQRIAVQTRIVVDDSITSSSSSDQQPQQRRRYYNLFGCHITRSISLLQMSQILAIVENQNLTHLIIAGEFNLKSNGTIPNTDYYGWTNEEAEKRIDMFFVSHDLSILQVEHIGWRNC